MKRALSLIAALAVAACAPLPPAPAPQRPPPRPAVSAPPSTSGALQTAIAKHEKLARVAREAGELATAAEHYGVLVLLDPADPAHAQALRGTRAAIDEGIQEQLRVAAAARKDGNAAKAREALLRVLLLDPGHAEAAKGLRELEQAAMARTQAERAARARSMDEVIASARARAAAANTSMPDNGADLDQRLELVRSSDASIALREARAWADANPGDRAGRQRLAVALAERARDLDAKGQREWALPLYDQAATLGGTAQADAAKRAAALRKAFADDAYAAGMRARNSDLATAIRHWETALRYDPQHTKARDRLREARAAQKKLERIAK